LNRLVFWVIFWGLWLGRSSWADDVAQFRNFIQPLTASVAIRGTFEQVRTIPALSRPLISTGQYVIAEGLGMLWLQERPIATTLAMTPRGAHQWIRNRPVASSASLNDGVSHMYKVVAALFRGDLADIQKTFKLQITGDATQWRLVLVPHDAGIAAVLHDVNISGGSGEVRSIDLADSMGNKTSITLTPKTTVAPLSDAEKVLLEP
jgi:hypothetical protein